MQNTTTSLIGTVQMVGVINKFINSFPSLLTLSSRTQNVPSYLHLQLAASENLQSSSALDHFSDGERFMKISRFFLRIRFNTLHSSVCREAALHFLSCRRRSLKQFYNGVLRGPKGRSFCRTWSCSNQPGARLSFALSVEFHFSSLRLPSRL